MVRTVRSPGNRVDLASVPFEAFNHSFGLTNVQNQNLVAILLDGRQLVGVLLVPGDAQQRLVAVIYDVAGLQISKVEKSCRAILTA